MHEDPSREPLTCLVARRLGRDKSSLGDTWDISGADAALLASACARISCRSCGVYPWAGYKKLESPDGDDGTTQRRATKASMWTCTPPPRLDACGGWAE
mmetsp:Transcript_44362/g.117683  ORF Transcript_44362/g.117683 Transcript_44362/m.117683 type:complete len:99 (+) Transcript_44362:272-568(+)